MAGRKVRGEAEAHQCLAEVEASGLSLAAWARREGIDGRSLSMWRVNLARRGAKPGQRMVELVPSAPKTPARYLIRRGEFAVEVGDDFEQDTLFRILDVVSAC
jgi:hypothetical protein